jgi:ubiquinol-cytochrome c reductase cytochrome b subunit
VTLIEHNRGVPPAGALSLLKTDPKTRGPELFLQHCAACHSHTGTEHGMEHQITAEEVSAPNLGRYATREWIAGWLDPKRITSPDYFGNTAFENGDMVNFVEDVFPEDMDEMDREDRGKIVAALAAEAQLPGEELSPEEQEVVAEGRELILDFGCVDCHKFRDEGSLGTGPDLTGYGSAEWTVAIIANAADKRFYGDSNDRMPAYAESGDPQMDILPMRDVRLITDWLRGDWFEPNGRR